MRILLMLPPLFFNKSSKTKGIPGFLPPLGIGYLASVLIEKGHEILLLDSQVNEIPLNNILKKINDFQPDFIGISFMTPWLDATKKFIKILKENFEIPIIVGGAHPTCYPKETINNIPEIDFLFTDECEKTFLDFLENYPNLDLIPNIKTEKINNSYIIYSKDIVDINSLPFPNRSMFDMKLYSPEPFESRYLPATTIIASRGCSYSKCTFCWRNNKSSFYKKFRIRKVESVINEIDMLIKKYNMKHIIFYDDNLLDNKKWVMDFCNLIKQKNLKFKWTVRGRLINKSNELLSACSENGLWLIEYGYESGNQRLLNLIQKGTQLEDFKNITELTKKNNIEIFGTFMLGLPTETPEETLKTINMAKYLNIDIVAFIPFHPFKGTPIYDLSLKHGKFINKLYKKKITGNRFIPNISYLTETYDSEKQLQKMIKYAYRSYYFRPQYIFNSIKKIKNLDILKSYFNSFKLFLNLT